MINNKYSTRNPKKIPLSRGGGAFLVFIKKEFYHIWRDKRTLFILLGIPITQIIIFGFALTNEVKNSKIAILDFSKDVASQQLIQKFSASKYFYYTANLYSYKEVEPIFKEGKIKMILVIPQQFANDLVHANKTQVQLICDATDPNVASTLSNYAGAVIRDYQNIINQNQKLPYRIETEVRMMYNPELKGAYSFVPGVMALILMLTCAMMTSIAIVKEKEMGTMEIILVSPLKPFGVVVAKAIPYMLLSMINVITILLLSFFVLDVPIAGSLSLLIAESLLFTITSLALGLLISSLTNSQQAAMLISLLGLFLPTTVFSGYMFPIENMPVPLQVMSNIVPAKWYYYIVKTVMIKGLGFTYIWKETLILIGMTIVLFTLSIKKFKIRLE
jgi:ABC-2 type transport system permease protein